MFFFLISYGPPEYSFYLTFWLDLINNYCLTLGKVICAWRDPFTKGPGYSSTPALGSYTGCSGKFSIYYNVCLPMSIHGSIWRFSIWMFIPVLFLKKDFGTTVNKKEEILDEETLK